MEGLEKKNMKNLRVLISGAGIGGLAAAGVFTQRGICPDIIEKHEKSALREGTGIALPANGVWALHKLGFEEDLKQRAYVINNMSFAKPDGEMLTTRTVGDIHPEGTPFMAIHRESLRKMLESRITHVPIQYDTTITATEAVGETVNVTFSTGEKKTYDLVIGADGIRSQLRSFLSPTEAPLVYHNLFTWRTVVTLQVGEEGPKDPIYMMGEDTFFLIYPISTKGDYYIYAHEKRERREKESLEIETDKFFNLFKAYGGEAPKMLRWFCPEDIITGFIESVPEVVWGEGRQLLIGDAAHGCMPGQQQGGALTLEDVYVWGEELDKGFSAGLSLDQVLENFKVRRQGRVQRVVDLSNGRMKLMSQQSMQERYEAIKQHGPLNRPGFIEIMKQNP